MHASKVGSAQAGAIGAARTPLGRTWEVLSLLIVEDFRLRYRGQALGFVWSVLNPLVTMAVMSLVLVHIFKVAVPNYPVFVLTGLVYWQFVSTAWVGATTSFVAYADLTKRCAFPRWILPLATIVSRLVNLAIEASIVLVIAPFFPGSLKLTPALLALPLVLLSVIVLVMGLGLITSVLNPIFRDVAYLVTTLQFLLYWVTPILYPPDLLPESLQRILALNPLGSSLTAIRNLIMDGRLPSFDVLLPMTATTVAVFLTGVLVYRRFVRVFPDHL